MSLLQSTLKVLFILIVYVIIIQILLFQNFSAVIKSEIDNVNKFDQIDYICSI